MFRQLPNIRSLTLFTRQTVGSASERVGAQNPLSSEAHVKDPFNQYSC
jgi:hypothetical protein